MIACLLPCAHTRACFFGRRVAHHETKGSGARSLRSSLHIACPLAGCGTRSPLVCAPVGSVGGLRHAARQLHRRRGDVRGVLRGLQRVCARMRACEAHDFSRALSLTHAHTLSFSLARSRAHTHTHTHTHTRLDFRSHYIPGRSHGERVFRGRKHEHG